jgi:predicted TPR repeat methyltransferase
MAETTRIKLSRSPSALAEGDRLAAAGRLEEALPAYRAALARNPDHPEIRCNLGNILLGLGQAEEALATYQEVLARGFDHPLVHYNIGTAFRALGQPERALPAFEAALARAPSFAPAHNNRGNALRDLGRHAEAATAYLDALAVRPSDTGTRVNLASVLSLLYERDGQMPMIPASPDTDTSPVSGRDGGPASSWTRSPRVTLGGRGCARPASEDSLNESPSRPDGMSPHEDPKSAVALARRWRTAHPEDPMARHVAAALIGDAPPPRAEDGYVRALFDGFAADFDRQLASLAYSVPALVETLDRLWPQPSAAMTVLDAGCGTGFSAPMLRPHARHLTGVDLSPEMLALAQQRQLYDALELTEITAFLANHPEGYDLIVATDVLCYFGTLAPVLGAAAAALRPGGRVMFTVELDPAPNAPAFTLQSNGRYRHAETAILALLEASGLDAGTPMVNRLRRENGRDVPGGFFEARRRDSSWMTKPGGSR